MQDGVQTRAGGSAEKLVQIYAHLQRLEEWLGTALYQPVSYLRGLWQFVLMYAEHHI